ncbi:Protein CBG02806, partial [Caenorhabditis briggsae]
YVVHKCQKSEFRFFFSVVKKSVQFVLSHFLSHLARVIFQFVLHSA